VPSRAQSARSPRTRWVAQQSWSDRSATLVGDCKAGVLSTRACSGYSLVLWALAARYAARASVGIDRAVQAALSPPTSLTSPTPPTPSAEHPPSGSKRHAPAATPISAPADGVSDGREGSVRRAWGCSTLARAVPVHTQPSLEEFAAVHFGHAPVCLPLSLRCGRPHARRSVHARTHARTHSSIVRLSQSIAQPRQRRRRAVSGHDTLRSACKARWMTGRRRSAGRTSHTCGRSRARVSCQSRWAGTAPFFLWACAQMVRPFVDALHCSGDAEPRPTFLKLSQSFETLPQASLARVCGGQALHGRAVGAASDDAERLHRWLCGAARWSMPTEHADGACRRRIGCATGLDRGCPRSACNWVPPLIFAVR
jgi:hypothetical protein